MSFDDLPDDVLIRLLNTASPRDVAKTKRLNKRFHQLVETYNLGKPRVKEFSIESRIASMPTTPTTTTATTTSSLPKIGRIRFGNPQKTSKRRLVVTMKREKGIKRVERIDDPTCSNLSQNAQNIVFENLRRVVIDDRLSLDGITIDNSFYEMLTARSNNLSNITTVSLSFCTIQLSWSTFLDLLSKMKLKNLYLDFCTFNPELISDKVLMSLEALEILKIQPRTQCYLNELTDRTLIYWSQRENIPKSIQIYNCGSCVTVDGIKTLMTTAITRSDILQSIDWDFGLLFEPTQTDSVLLSLIFSPGLKLSIVDDFRSRRVRLNRDKLQLAFNIYYPLLIYDSPQPNALQSAQHS